ncbi:MAG: hypothetical protein MRY83_04490 [Flavobacteriales bacterium]|nr:hypothetical protein [Flavobacteriales bacterium]
MKRSLLWISIVFFAGVLASNSGCNNGKNETKEQPEAKTPMSNNTESEPDAQIMPMDSVNAQESGVADSTKSSMSKEDKYDVDDKGSSSEAPSPGSDEQSKIDSIKAAKKKLKK